MRGLLIFCLLCLGLLAAQAVLEEGVRSQDVVAAQDAAPPGKRSGNTADGQDATRERELPWGLYQIYWGHSYEQHLRESLGKFASAPDYLMFYRDLGRGFPASGVAAIRAQGATPIVSLELWRWHDRERHSDLAAIVDGEYDAFFSEWARDAADEGGRLLLRFGFEMNGDWFSWSGDPQAFVAAWRHAHALFDEQGAHNVEWVFCPNVVGIPRTPENATALYDPGDEWIDWVALDGYNFGDEHDPWHHWESFGEVFEQPLRELIGRHPDRPVLIGEMGCAPGPRRAQWVRDAHAWLLDWPQVRGVIWFDHDKSREGEPDWRIDNSVESLAAFNQTFAAP